MNTEKLVIVTCAAGVIGKGIATLLLERDYTVAVLDSDSDALEKLHGEVKHEERLLSTVCDVADEASIKHSLEKFFDQRKNLVGLVNNAGIAKPESGPVENLSREDWQRWIDVDLTGPFLVAKHCIPQLKKNAGAIVNIASTRAIQSEADCEAYAAAKGGLVGLSHAMALSLSGKVRVNAISPGWIAGETGYAQLSEEDHRQHPAGRVGKPADIATMVAYLLSEEAGFITGQNFVIDGGMTKKMMYV